jgi:hypothetical protein
MSTEIVRDMELGLFSSIDIENPLEEEAESFQRFTNRCKIYLCKIRTGSRIHRLLLIQPILAILLGIGIFIGGVFVSAIIFLVTKELAVACYQKLDTSCGYFTGNGQTNG